MLIYLIIQLYYNYDCKEGVLLTSVVSQSCAHAKTVNITYTDQNINNIPKL